MGLRSYQVQCLDAIKSNYEEGIEKQVAVLATGLGKTTLAAHIPDNFPNKRVLFLVHTDELAQQAKDEMEIWNKGATVGIEMGTSRAEDRNQIVVASVQTLGREGSSRIHRFKPQDFGAVIVDECHHSVGKQYEEVLKWFGFHGDNNPGRLLLGITATPGRADGLGLARTFDRVVFNYGLTEAIKDGWLCGLRGARIRTGVSLDEVGVTAGEFNKHELALTVNTPDRNRRIAEAWIEHAENRKTLGFCVTIKHSQDLSEAFRAAGVSAEAVWGDDPDRSEKLKAHKRGDFKVILNAAVLVEGYNDKSIRCVLLAKPCKSKSRYIQMVGRGTRLPHGIDNLHEARAAGIELEKTDCLVLDCSDSSVKHSLVSLPSIFGLPPRIDLKARDVLEVAEMFEQERARRPDTDFSALEDLENVRSYVEKVDLFSGVFAPEVLAGSKYQWHKNGEAYVLSLPGMDKIEITQDIVDRWSIKGKVQGNSFEDSEGNLGDAFGTADRYLRMFGRAYMAKVRRETKKDDGTPATASQLSAIRYCLKERGKDVPDMAGVTKVEATVALRRLMNL